MLSKYYETAVLVSFVLGLSGLALGIMEWFHDGLLIAGSILFGSSLIALANRR